LRCGASKCVDGESTDGKSFGLSDVAVRIESIVRIYAVKLELYIISSGGQGTRQQQIDVIEAYGQRV